jgi:hypothetical protein
MAIIQKHQNISQIKNWSAGVQILERPTRK